MPCAFHRRAWILLGGQTKLEAREMLAVGAARPTGSPTRQEHTLLDSLLTLRLACQTKTDTSISRLRFTIKLRKVILAFL